MTSKELLISKLKNFAENLRSFKKLFDKYPPPDKNLDLKLEKT